MGKRSSRQHWDDDGVRPRVLLECPPEASPSIIATLIEREGYAVRTCDGPSATTCELLASGVCPLVDGADVVVNLLGDAPRDRAVLDAVACVRRPPAIVTEVRSGSPALPTAPPAAAARITALRYPATRQSLLSAIRGAIAPGAPGQRTSS